MARPLRLEFAGAVYHLTARGNARRDIFLDDADRIRFLSLLAREVAQQGWLCYAYCLMNNHYHLLIETPEPNLVAGMRRLNGAYCQAFNRRHEQVGHVLQGRYQSIVVDRDNYLLELCRYLVLNPVRAGMVARAEAWRWSSYRATLGRIKAPAWLAVDQVLPRFGATAAGARAGYRRFVAEGVATASPWRHLRGRIWLGDADFLARMQRRLRRLSAVDVPADQRHPARPDRADILASVAAAYGLAEADLLRRADQSAYRAAAYLLRRAANLPLKEVAALFGVSPSRISRIQGQVAQARPNARMRKLLTRYKVKN